MTQRRLHVAIPVPIAEGFDYRWSRPDPTPPPGTRVRVPFGKGERIGIVIAPTAASPVDDARLKDVREVLDGEPLIEGELMESLNWAADYYHHPIGEVLAQALPVLLRQGRPATAPAEPAWTLSAVGREVEIEALRRKAPRQAAALELLLRASKQDLQVLVDASVRGFPDPLLEGSLRLP